MRKAILCLAAVLCLLCSSALAELGWVDEELSAFLDINNDTSFSLGIQLGQLQPFGEEPVALMNETLAHIAVESRIMEDGTQMAICVDGESLLTIEEMAYNGRMALTTSLLPNRVLVSSTSPMDILSGNEMAQEPLFDLHTAISQVEELYPALAEAIVPYATEKAANYKISGIGYARWVRLARLTQEDAQVLLPQIIQVLGCGMDQAFREQLQGLTCGDNFTIAVYYDEENGTPLALYMKGNVYLTEGEKWTLAYQWAFTRQDGQLEDTYRYELEQSKSPRHKRVIEAKRLSGGETGQPEWSHQSELTVKDDQQDMTLTHKDELKLLEGEGRAEVVGSLTTTVKERIGKETTTTSTAIVPNLMLTSAQGSGVLSGTVTVTEKQGKNVMNELTFTFAKEAAQALAAADADGSLFAVGDVDPMDPSVAGSSLAQNVEVIWADETQKGYVVGNPPIGMTAYHAPATQQTVDLDSISPTQLAALQDEMAQNAAGVLLIALARLPGEPLGLLSDLMTDVDYAAFLSLLGDL